VPASSAPVTAMMPLVSVPEPVRSPTVQRSPSASKKALVATDRLFVPPRRARSRPVRTSTSPLKVFPVPVRLSEFVPSLVNPPSAVPASAGSCRRFCATV